MIGRGHIDLLSHFIFVVENEPTHSIAELETLNIGANCDYRSGNTVTKTQRELCHQTSINFKNI